MELGIHFIDFLPGDPADQGPTLVATAKAAEDAGATMFTLADHLFQMEGLGRAEDPFLEGYTSLGFLAGQTTSITLALLVTGVTYRHPGVLAKTVTTLDVLSQGRSMFGIGAAWYEREHVALGVPYPPLRDRFEMLEETLQIAKQMWSADNGPYRGKHYRLEQTLCVPQPLSRPHPPILVAGGGEKKTLRLVAQYADACNLYGSVETIRAKLDILKKHCEALGRDYRTIEITTLGTLDLQPGKMSSKEVIAHCKALAGIGVQHAVFNMPTVHELAPIERFRRQIIPVVAAY